MKEKGAILCIELTRRTIEALESLIKLGYYQDFSQAISVAIANQLLLHRRVGKEGVVIISNDGAPSPAPAMTDDSQNAARSSSQRGSFQRIASIPALFGPLSSSPTNETAAPLPNDTFVPGQEIPVDRWFFGQHNKLLPAKASCRALANLLCRNADAGNGMPLARASSEIAGEAVGLGNYLRLLDQRHGLDRDDALSFAFPCSRSETEDKARIRYANQFVASINNQGLLSGLLIDLKLINRDHGKNPRILLTGPGWNFARLQNPVLDGGSTSEAPNKFSAEEIAFLLEHIHSCVPAEDFAYRMVLGALTDGANTPEKLDTVLARFFSPRQGKPFSRAFLATQRSGVISRMADLSLVRRVREGIRVTYAITQPGTEYLATARGNAK